ncbi:Eukaryotic translation initiation factor 4E type 2 [Allomyces javanicus]|nr:Eukaryotic translation initiation factor 4E type 2 [Allomyces javanicus]
MSAAVEHAPKPAAEAAPVATAPKAGVHPLHDKWVLYYNGPSKDKSANWEDLVKRVMTFDTVEDFWGLFNNIPRVEDLANQSDYNLFRDPIFPAWEHPDNREGGKWLLAVSGGDIQGLSRMWLDSCLFAIGEQFEDTKEICGVVVSVRPRGHKLCLWTRSALDEEKTVALGKAWKEALGLGPESKIKYQIHSSSVQSQRSFPKGEAYSL